MERLKKIGMIQPVSAKEIKFSRVGIGFEKLDRAVFDPEKAYDKVAALGVKWIRLQSGWQRTEKQKGVYDWKWLDSIVDNLICRGLVPWICICYGNPIYNPEAAEIFGSVGVPPIKSNEQKLGWANYVRALTAHFKGRVKWYEVWNEPDGEWCWKHGPDGMEYGNFVIDTSRAIKAGDSEAKVIAGAYCTCNCAWLDAMFRSGCGAFIDAFSYHDYMDDINTTMRLRMIRALCHQVNPAIKLVQGETGTQSRSDGRGAFSQMAWTQQKQAKFLIRRMITDFSDDVMFSSYFSTLDMIEALNGKTDDLKSYLDYAYFGVLAADFDENGFSTGAYTPKLSYRSLQTIASIFREDFTVEDIPVLCHQEPCRRIGAVGETDLRFGCFLKPNGSRALAFWKETPILTSSFESVATMDILNIPECTQIRLTDLFDGSIYEIPDTIMSRTGSGNLRLTQLPVGDYPMLLTFGDFCGM